MEEARKGVFTLPLSKPLKSGEKEYTDLNIDLSALTAQDMLNCEAQWTAQYGRSSQIPSHSAAFQLIVAARALNIPVEDLVNHLTMKESIALCNIVVSFLIC
ncbi:MAG: hypothetical protein ACRDBM_09310 [Sporomusa sp.]